MCYPFDRQLYYKMGRHVKINGYRFTLECGDQRGALCGEVIDPINYKDCAIYSTTDNSCCFYSYQYKNPDDDEYQQETNCVWLGTPDIGKMNYNKLTVNYKKNYIKVKMFAIFALFANLFI